jgi:1-acyl-sn-glycerol-3-phosphate acyltransferase
MEMTRPRFAPVDAASRFLRILSGTRRHVGVLRAGRGGSLVPPPEILHPVMKAWGEEMLATLRVRIEATGDREFREPALLVGNHVSYLDIPLLMTQLPVVFVAKSQIGKWPVFGEACRSVGTVFVERESGHSRKLAGEAIGPYIRREHRSVAIFPSGTTTVDEAKPWRWGAFLIAKRYDIPVRPFRLKYTPLRRAAFIDADIFPVHLWQLINAGEIRAEIEFHAPVRVGDPEADAERWWRWSREKLIGAT